MLRNSAHEKSRALFLCPRVGLPDIGQAQEIIYAGVVQLGESDQSWGRDVVFTGLVFGISGLGHIQQFRNFRLCHVAVFAQAFQVF